MSMTKEQRIKQIRKVFGVKSFEDAAATAQSFKDSTGGLIFAQNLQHISPEVFTQAFPDLTLLSLSGIQVNNEGAGATSITKLKLSIQGGFRQSGDNTDTKGRITLTGESDTIPVSVFDAESDWSQIELERAQRQNINLPSRLMEAHSELYQREIDSIGFVGQTLDSGASKTEGLLNYSGFTSTAASGAASTLTGAQLYDEISGLINDQWNDVLNVEEYKANMCVLPTGVYNLASRLVYSTSGTTTKTVLQALRENMPSVTFFSSTKANSVGGSSVTCAFSNGRRAMQLRIPDPLAISNVYQMGFKFGVGSYFGIAGIDFIENKGGRLLTGL